MPLSDHCTRTDEEILTRFHAVTNNDMFGWQREVLAEALSYDAAVEHKVIRPDVDRETWEAKADVHASALKYLTFAWGKAEDHRGLSAGRSIDKLTSYAWLLGGDDVLEEMETASYAQYGVPKLLVFTRAIGAPDPTQGDTPDAKALQRMAEGLPCRPECMDGCG
jgi:hypothetical protein